MPEKSFKQLKNVRIRRQAIEIKVSDTQPTATRTERRPN